MYSVAVIEDNREAAESIRKCFEKYGSENKTEFGMTVFESSEAFLNRYRPIYDLVLMDIQLPGMNGMDAAARLREMDEAVLLIFVTNMAQFAVKGYEVNAFDFIVKPLTYPSFSMKLSRALKRLGNRGDRQIILNANDRIYRISEASITYIEVTGHTLIYHTTEGDISTYGSLKQAEGEVSAQIFARCNSCYLVNMNYVHSIDGSDVRVGSDTLQISRSRRKDFIRRLNDYLGENL